jgi:bile acid-coenzyme A ligase
VLERHPLVRSAVAFGVADAELGSRVQAIVDVAEAALTAEDLQLWLSSRLDREKLPRVLEIVRDPVRDDAGKVRRGLLASERAARAPAPPIARAARN